jgi:uncharacterized protein (DUF3820 family)
LSQLQQQQQLLKQDMPISQILRTYGKQFTQIQMRYSDGYNGRCAIGLIMSYFGWNGKNDPGSARRLLAAFVSLKNEGIDEEIIMKLNDSGYTFDEIANYLDRVEK